MYLFRFFNAPCEFSPLFYTLTWQVNFNEKTKLEERFPSLKIFKQFPKNTIFHIAAGILKHQEVNEILTKLLDFGIRNIFVIRGGI